MNYRVFIPIIMSVTSGVYAGEVPVSLLFEQPKPAVDFTSEGDSYGTGCSERKRTGQRDTEHQRGRWQAEQRREGRRFLGNGWTKQIWAFGSGKSWRKWRSEQLPLMSGSGWGLSEQKEAQHIWLASLDDVPQGLVVSAPLTFVLVEVWDSTIREVDRLEGYQDSHALLKLWETGNAARIDAGDVGEAQVRSFSNRSTNTVSDRLFDWVPLEMWGRSACPSGVGTS